VDVEEDWDGRVEGVKSVIVLVVNEVHNPSWKSLLPDFEA
jgi:hypothetical protein